MTAAKRWVSEAKLRALFNAGLTYDEIAEANERAEGWRPHRSVVARKLESIGMPKRHISHTELLPWHVRPEHNQSRLRYMLQAESRKRQGIDLSRSDLALVRILHDLLFGRGAFMVVAYSPATGFYLTERTDEDDDIIRVPQVRPEIDDPHALAVAAFQLGITPGHLERLGKKDAARHLRRLIADFSNSPDPPQGKTNVIPIRRPKRDR